MLLVPRKVLFDVMARKHAIKLAEDEAESNAFKELCQKANAMFDDAMRKSPKSKNDAMNAFSESMIKFMKDHVDSIRYVGQGSSRMVYAMADGTALKIAKNSSGIAQNWQESKNCMDPDMNYAIFPDFYGTDTKTWLALNCELCAPATHKDFMTILKAQPMLISLLVDSVFYNAKKPYPPLDDMILAMNEKYDLPEDLAIRNFVNSVVESKTEAMKAIKSLMQFYYDHSLDDMLSGDLYEVENWGITERNGQKTLVVIDAGFSEKVWQSFYAK